MRPGCLRQSIGGQKTGKRTEMRGQKRREEKRKGKGEGTGERRRGRGQEKKGVMQISLFCRRGEIDQFKSVVSRLYMD